jgi:hypothetical protein
VQAFRRGAERCSDEDLAAWYRAVAEAVEAGDAALVGHNALWAMKQLDACWRSTVLALAKIGKKKLEADKRRVAARAKRDRFLGRYFAKYRWHIFPGASPKTVGSNSCRRFE